MPNQSEGLKTGRVRRSVHHRWAFAKSAVATSPSLEQTWCCWTDRRKTNQRKKTRSWENTLLKASANTLNVEPLWEHGRAVKCFSVELPWNLSRWEKNSLLLPPCPHFTVLRPGEQSLLFATVPKKNPQFDVSIKMQLWTCANKRRRRTTAWPPNGVIKSVRAS